MLYLFFNKRYFRKPRAFIESKQKKQNVMLGDDKGERNQFFEFIVYSIN